MQDLTQQKTKIFHFQHNYKKFNSLHFTTIRGKSSYKKYQYAEIVKIMLKNRLLGSAMIYKSELQKISEIPLELLKKDTSYNGFEIINKEDFITLLNSFPTRRRFKIFVDLESVVTIFYLEQSYDFALPKENVNYQRSKH